jgi:hypothetical protein
MIKTAILAIKVSFVWAAGVLAKGRMFDMPAYDIQTLLIIHYNKLL